MVMIAGNSVQPFNVTAKEPTRQGTLAVPDTLDFTAASVVVRDYSPLQNENKFTCIQCIYVDNSQNPASLTVICSDTLQNVTWPGGWQGYANLQTTNNMKISFVSSGGMRVPVQLLNYDQGTRLWPANGNAGTPNAYFAWSVPVGGASTRSQSTLWNPPQNNKTVYVSSCDLINGSATAQQNIISYTTTLVGALESQGISNNPFNPNSLVATYISTSAAIVSPQIDGPYVGPNSSYKLVFDDEVILPPGSGLIVELNTVNVQQRTAYSWTER